MRLSLLTIFGLLAAAQFAPTVSLDPSPLRHLRSTSVGEPALETLERATAAAQPLTRDTQLSAADLQADLAVLKDAYETLHPGLLRYNTPAQVDTAFAATARTFASGATLAVAFRELTRLTASLRCGHSNPNFWNQPRRIADALFEGRDKLPIEFRWLDGRMIVTRDLRAVPNFPAGTEVLSIDGTPAREVLAQLVPLARADGANDAKRIAYLEVRAQARYHAFDILYPLVFPVRDGRFALVVRTPDGATRAENADAMNGAERRTLGTSITTQTTADAAASLWTYDVRDGLAVLRMPTWALFNSKWNATAWTDSIMADLIARRVPDLVIDLRGNEGGLDAGNQLLARLITAPLELPVYRRVVRAVRVPDRLRPVLDTWDNSFFDWGAQARPSDDPRFFRLTRWDDTDSGGNVIQPRGPRYTGKVWVLVDAANSSATFQFALAVKRSGVATLVGQPTGGNRRGINGGAFFFLRLPRTGLEVDLPLIAGLPSTAEPDAGVEPDLLVQPTIGDVAAGRDAELEAVRHAIRQRR